MSAPDAIAVDVVLLLPGSVAQWAIRVNAGMNERTSTSRIVLGEDKGIPHISLAMGAVPAADLGALAGRLGETSRRFLPVNLFPEGIVTVTTSTGEQVSGLNLERTRPLLDLHREVMEAVAAYRIEPVGKEMIAGHEDGPITPFTCDYIAQYPEKSAYEAFSPHITLGYWRVDPDLRTGPRVCMFRSTRLAICHLGNDCTCRRVISVHPAPGTG